MAEQDWEPKRVRRARARQERKRQQQEAARARRRRRWVTRLWSIVGVAMLVAAVVVTLLGDDQEAVASVLSGREVEAARDRAGCEVVTASPSGSPEHVDDGTAPGSVLAGAIVPPTGTAHYAGTHPPVAADVGRQLDAISLGHNLEHGAVVVWYDPDRIDVDASGLAAWADGLNAAGFDVPVAGASVFVSPFEEPGISSGKALAMRSWALGVDCDAFDPAAAGSFVVEAYGRGGGAPEGVPYPQDALAYAPGDQPTPYVATQTGTIDPTPGGEAPGSTSPGGAEEPVGSPGA